MIALADWRHRLRLLVGPRRVAAAFRVVDVNHPETVADGVGLLDRLDDHLTVERLQSADPPRLADAQAEAICTTLAS